MLRTWDGMGRDHVTLVAAGVGFYCLLAIFPAITAMISIWGLAFDPQTIEQQIEQIATALPQQAADIVREQARGIAEDTGTGASLAAIGGILLALYAAMKGVKSLMEGLNLIYGEDEKRGFVKLNLVALALTVVLILMMITALGLIAVYPAVVGFIGLGATVETLISWLRWPLLAVVAVIAMAVLYAFAPSRSRAQWRWVSVGAVVGTALWVIASIAFSIYVQNFGSYNETYGTLGAGIVLLMWLWLSAVVVLMGAELNSETEHQTARDTTVGPARAMGRRGARVADTLGQRP